MRLTALPLPEAPYVPGRTARPRSGLFFDIAHAAPEITDPARWRDNEAWLYGFDLYGNGFFWETHEVWEPVWMGARPNSPERVLVQGLIHLANACLKLEMGRVKAAVRLVDLGCACLADAGAAASDSPVMGMAVSPTLTAARAFAALLGDASAGAERLLGGRPVLRPGRRVDMRPGGPFEQEASPAAPLDQPVEHHRPGNAGDGDQH